MGRKRQPKDDPDGVTGLEISQQRDVVHTATATATATAEGVYTEAAIKESILQSDSQEHAPLVAESKNDSKGVPQPEFGLPNDSYSFILLSGPESFPFWFGIFVWIVQVCTMMLFFTDQVDTTATRNKFLIPGNVEVSVRISQAIAIIISIVFAGASLNDLLTSIELLFTLKQKKDEEVEDRRFLCRLVVQAILRFIQGLLGVVVTTLLIVQSDTVFNLILDFTAVAFVSQLDDVAYELAIRTYFGEICHLKALQVEANDIPKGYKVKRNPTPLGLRMYYWRFLALFLIGSAMFSSYLFVTSKQINGFFLCEQMQVEFGDEVVPLLGAYNGIYERVENEFSDRGRVVYRQNLETIHDGKLGYCGEENAWTLYTNDSEGPCDYIIKSAESRSFEIETTSADLWFTQNGRPIEYNKFRCLAYTEKDAKEDNELSFDGSSCTQVLFDISSLTTDDGLIFSFNQIFELLPNIKSHGQNVYRARIKEPELVDYFEHFNETAASGDDDDDDYFDWDYLFDQGTDGDIVVGEDFFICHNWFNPLTGEIEKKSLLSTDVVWVTDSLGCCDGVCPSNFADLDFVRPWFPWLPTDEDEGDDKYPFEPDLGDDYDFVEYLDNIIDFEYPAINTNFDTDTKSKDDIGPCSGLNAYLIFNGRRWMHVVSENSSICHGNFHTGYAFLSGSDFTITHVSNEIDGDSPNQATPHGLTWYLADRHLLEYPAADLRLEVFTPISCTNEMPWENILEEEGGIPVYISRFQTIQHLDFAALDLQGTIPTQIGFMTALTHLDLRGNSITGILPSELGNLNSLLHLNLSKNRLSGTFPSELTNLKNLEELLFMGNDGLQGGGLLQILKATTSLKSLAFGDNALEGNTPIDLFQLSQLTSLVVKYSGFQGSLPTQIGLMTNLETLSLPSNFWTGTLPTEIFQLSNLKMLDVWGNLFTGTIPTEIGNLTALRVLLLWGNELAGTIPTELAKLTKLHRIEIDVNSLTGTIPTDLDLLTDLNVLYISNNELTGEFPVELCDIPFLFLDNQANETVFECYPDASCFSNHGVGIPGCKCHPDCLTCGYSRRPTTKNDCLSCHDGTSIDYPYDDDWYQVGTCD